MRRAPPEPSRVDEAKRLPWWKRAVLDSEFRRGLTAAISSAHRLLEEHATAGGPQDPWRLPATDRGSGNKSARATSARAVVPTISSGPAVRPPTATAPQSQSATALLGTRAATANSVGSSSSQNNSKCSFSRNTLSELALLAASKQRIDIALSRGDWVPYSATNRAPGDGATYRWIGDFPLAGFHVAYSRDMASISGLEPPVRPAFDTIGTAEVPASVAVFATRPEYPHFGGVVMPRDAMCVFLVSDSALGRRKRKKHVQYNTSEDDDVARDPNSQQHPLLEAVHHTTKDGVRWLQCDRDDPNSVARTGVLPEIESEQLQDGSGGGHPQQHQKKKKQKQNKHAYCVPVVDAATAEEEAKKKKIQSKQMQLSHLAGQMKDKEAKMSDRHRASSTQQQQQRQGGTTANKHADSSSSSDEDDDDDDDDSGDEGNGVDVDGEEKEVENDETAKQQQQQQHPDEYYVDADGNMQKKTKKKRKKTHAQILRAKYGDLLPKGTVGFSFGAPKFIAYMWPSHRLVRFRLLSAALLKLAQQHGEESSNLAAGFPEPSDPLASYIRPDITDSRIEFLFSSDPCREAMSRIFERLPKDAHNRLEQKSFVNFCLALYNLYMPQYSDKINFLLAESEWAARGVADHSLDFLIFFWFFFDFPLFLIRDTFIREVDYVEFWNFTHDQLYVERNVTYIGVDFDDVMALRRIEAQLQSRVPPSRLPNRARLELQLHKQRVQAHERRSQLLVQEQMHEATRLSELAARGAEERRKEMLERAEAMAKNNEMMKPDQQQQQQQQRVAPQVVSSVAAAPDSGTGDGSAGDAMSAYRRRRQEETKQLLSFREYLGQFDSITGAKIAKEPKNPSLDQQQQQQWSSASGNIISSSSSSSSNPWQKQQPANRQDAANDDDDDDDDENGIALNKHKSLANDPDAPENNIEQLLDFVDDMTDSDLEEIDGNGRLVIFDRFRLSKEMRRRRDYKKQNFDNLPSRLLARNAKIDSLREKKVLADELRDMKQRGDGDGGGAGHEEKQAGEGEEEEDPFPDGNLSPEDDDDNDASGDDDEIDQKQQQPQPSPQPGSASLRAILKHAAEVEEMEQDEDDDLAAAARRKRRVARMLAVRRKERTRLQELAQLPLQLRKVNKYTMFGAPMLHVPGTGGGGILSGGRPTSGGEMPFQGLSRNPQVATPRVESGRYVRSSEVVARREEAMARRAQERFSPTSAGSADDHPHHQQQQQQQSQRQQPTTELALPIIGQDAVSKVGQQTRRTSSGQQHHHHEHGSGATESHIRVAMLQSGFKMDLGENIERWKLREKEKKKKANHSGGGHTSDHLSSPSSTTGYELTTTSTAAVAVKTRDHDMSDAAKLNRLFARLQNEQQHPAAPRAIEEAPPTLGDKKFVGELPAQNQEDDDEIATLLQKIHEMNEREAYLAASPSIHAGFNCSHNNNSNNNRSGNNNRKSAPSSARPRLHVSQSELGYTLADQRMHQQVVLPRTSSLNPDLLAAQEIARLSRTQPLFQFPGHPSDPTARNPPSSSKPGTVSGHHSNLREDNMSEDEKRSTLFLASRGRESITAAHRQHPDLQLARWLTAVSRTNQASKTKAPFCA